MVHRLGISLDGADLKYIQTLQKRFHIKNRSEFFRELVRRYEKLEAEFSSLRACIAGYTNQPESADETKIVLHSTLKDQTPENW